MINAYIPDNFKQNIFFATKQEGKELLLEVLTKIAKHGIIIDDPVDAVYTDVFACHSGKGDFDVLYDDDGSVEIWAPTESFALELLDLFS